MANDLTQEKLKSVLAYSPDTGVFVWLQSRPGGAMAGDVEGQSNGDGRCQVNVMGRRYQLTHLAWFWTHGVWPSGEVDHRDGDCSNNRFDNLRDVDHKTNLENRTRANTRATGRSSSYLGVSWKKARSRWVANIGVSGVNKHLGYFDTEQMAHAAYLAAKREHHQGNTL